MGYQLLLESTLLFRLDPHAGRYSHTHQDESLHTPSSYSNHSELSHDLLDNSDCLNTNLRRSLLLCAWPLGWCLSLAFASMICMYGAMSPPSWPRLEPQQLRAPSYLDISSHPVYTYSNALVLSSACSITVCWIMTALILAHRFIDVTPSS